MDALFDIPEALSPRLAWMKRHRVLTHHSPDEKEAWLAIQARKTEAGMSIGAIMAKYCYLYDRLGLCGYGATENDALLDLCAKLKLQHWSEA